MNRPTTYLTFLNNQAMIDSRETQEDTKMIFPTWFLAAVAIYLATAITAIAIAQVMTPKTVEDSKTFEESPKTFEELDCEWVFGDLEAI